jgi:hypothetical protein
MRINISAGECSTLARCFACFNVFVLLLGMAIPHAVAQNHQTLSRTVTVTSNPPGATIWTKEGRAYTCTNQFTPGPIELKFHGENDVKQILLKRFGYASQKLSLDAAHDQAAVELTPWKAPFFTAPVGVSDEVRNLDVKVKQEFERSLIAANDAFGCTPFEFRSIGVVQRGNELELGVLMVLGHSTLTKSLLLARTGHGSEEERLNKMAHAALEGGIAEVIARFRTVAERVPQIKGIFVACSYSASEAVLNTRTETVTQYNPVAAPNTLTPYMPGGKYGTHMEMRPEFVDVETTTVEDQAAQRTMTFSVPVTALPVGRDNKSVIDAVLSRAAIRDFGNEE